MKMAVICCVLISEAAGYMYVFPFLPFMIRSFGVAEADVGFNSGPIPLKSVKFVLQQSTPSQIRQFILYYYCYKE